MSHWPRRTWRTWCGCAREGDAGGRNGGTPTRGVELGRRPDVRIPAPDRRMSVVLRSDRPSRSESGAQGRPPLQVHANGHACGTERRAMGSSPTPSRARARSRRVRRRGVGLQPMGYLVLDVLVREREAARCGPLARSVGMDPVHRRLDPGEGVVGALDPDVEGSDQVPSRRSAQRQSRGSVRFVPRFGFIPGVRVTRSSSGTASPATPADRSPRPHRRTRQSHGGVRRRPRRATHTRSLPVF